MTKSHRPIWILHYASAPIIGGVEGIISEHSRLLRTHGHRVQVVAGRGQPDHLLPELDSRHPAVLAVQAELDAGRVPEAFTALRERIRSALAELWAKDEPPVVIAHNALTLHKNLALAAALADLAAAGQAHVIAWCHDLSWTNELYLPVLHPGVPWDLLRTPQPGVRYVVISGERQQELAHLFGCPPEAICRVPNGIDPCRFSDAGPDMNRVLAHLDWLNRDPVLLAPVRMTRRKNLELALAVTAELRAHGDRPLLVITGPPGPHNPKQDYAEELYALREQLGLQAEVCFLSQVDWLPGGVSDNLMRELYRWADAMLFPSLQEGFGLPILEAGLARLPIFCTDLPVLREAGWADARYFAPQTAPAQIAAAIRARLAGPGEAALRRRVLHNYNWESIYRQHLLPLLNE